MKKEFAFVAGVIGMMTVSDLIVEKVRALRIEKTQKAWLESGKKLMRDMLDESIEWTKKYMRAIEETEEELS